MRRRTQCLWEKAVPVALAILVVGMAGCKSRSEGSPTDSGSGAGPGAASKVAVPRSERGCVTFVGDVKLSQSVARELHRDKRSPWRGFPFGSKERWVGNLEGAVVPAAGGRCRKPSYLCLGIAAADLQVLRGAPFVAMSLANNHSLDYGPAGLRETVKALGALGIRPLTEANAPVRLKIDGRSWALVPISLVGRPAAEAQAALERALLQIGLARASTPRVVVLPHWGAEHRRQPTARQEKLARLFRSWGATLVVGAHAHVVQPARCQADGAIYYGLGNHLFDQRGDAERHGLGVRCCPHGDGLRCTTFHTKRSRRSVAIRPSAVAGSTCAIRTGDNLDRSWQRHPAARRFVFVQRYATLGPHVFFALHRSFSAYDGEVALRPYVFRMEGTRHRDLWSGTALGRPLVAARIVSTPRGERLCAIHRDDSFLALDPKTRGRVRMAYRWNGFGFTGVKEGCGAPSGSERSRANR